jgi:hypothetical protein
MESSSALGKSKLSPTRRAIAVAAKRNIAITTMVLGLYSFRPAAPLSTGKRSNPCRKFLWHVGKHFKPRIGIVKHPAAGYRVKFQQLGITAAFANQAGNPPLDFGRDRLAYNGNIKLVLLASRDQTGFVQGGNHHMACALQDELPGPNNRGIETSA